MSSRGPSKEAFRDYQIQKSKRKKRLENCMKAKSGMTLAALQAQKEKIQMELAEMEGVNVSPRKKKNVERKAQEIVPLEQRMMPPLLDGLSTIDMCEKVMEYHKRGELAILLQPYGPEIGGYLIEMLRESREIKDNPMCLAIIKAIADIFKGAPKDTLMPSEVVKRIERVIIDVTPS